MKNQKILGLDLGPSSIGWSFIHKTESGLKIKSGVRVIPITTEEVNQFTKGQAITTSADRTLKRSARRNLDRYQMRRDKLVRKFQRLGWAKPSELQTPSNEMDIWALRSAAAVEKISLNDFAKVLFQLNKKRGYKSNRKANKEGETGSDYLSQISQRDSYLIDNDLTIGQAYYQEYLVWKANPNAVDRPRFKNIVYSRSSHEQEFNTIWQVQAKYHDVLTPSLKKYLGTETIFFQRKLKSKKHLIAKCTFEKHHRGIPVSSPLYEMFRLRQVINNLSFTNELSETIHLTHEEKELVFETCLTKAALSSKGKLTHSKLLKLLRLDKAQGWKANYEEIPGSTVLAGIYSLIEEHAPNRVEEFRFDPYVEGNEFDKQPIMQLWHLLYSEEDYENLIEILQSKFEFSKALAIGLEQIYLGDSYGSLSARAIKKILPFLEEGKEYSEACALAGYNHSSSVTKEENEQRMLLDELPHIKRTELRNPVVEKVMNQLINVVNAVLKHPEYGRPDAIHIELARELKANAKIRQEAYSQINKQKKYHEKIFELLRSEFRIKRPTRKDIIRYKLGEECGWVSVYSGKPIVKSQVFGPSAVYDIDHIIPQARLFDDSFQNKVLVERTLNEEKGAQTAYDFIRSTQGESGAEQFLERVHSSAFKKGKMLRLAMKGEDIPTDFIERQIRETQFITREALKRLNLVARITMATSGSITAHLRKEWGLEEVLKELMLPVYREQDLTYDRTIRDGAGKEKTIEAIKGWSKRDDHRHHALDAIVVALTERKHIKRLNDLNQTFEPGKVFSSKRSAVESPQENLREIVKESLSEILVSRKQGVRLASKSKINRLKKGGERHWIPRGPLHKETTHGKIWHRLEKPIPLKKFTSDYRAVNPDIGALLNQRLLKHDNDPKKAFSAKALKKNPVYYNERPITEVEVFEERFVTTKPLGPDIKTEYIVDKGTKYLIEQFIYENGGSAKKALANLKENPVWANKEKGVTIKKVRVMDKSTNLMPIHENGKGPKDFVFSGSNHHIAFYKNPDGQISVETVSFIQAFNRLIDSGTPFKFETKMGEKLVVSFQQNEFVLFDSPLEDFTKRSATEISQGLFRVQKMTLTSSSGPDIVFRHHLETSILKDVSLAMKRVTSIKSLPKYKVTLSTLGEITSIEEIELN